MSQTLMEEQTSNTPEDQMMGQFLKEISSIPLLTAQQEQKLAMGCAQGDEEAIHKMVVSNLRLVVSIARNYAGRGVHLLDLIQEGSMGLMAAARKFDYTRGVRFSTYATKWIKKGIIRYLLEQAEMIRVPAHTAEKIWKIRKVRSQLQQQLEREPTIQELAQACELPAKKLEKILQLLPEICSLDAPAGEQDTMLQQLLQDLQAPEPQEELVRQELKRILESLLKLLTTRQQQVLRLRFGMEDGIYRSLEEVGELLNISKERARQVEHEAIQKLKKYGADLGLEDFLE